ncbi:MAG: epoxyqueuosine reductase [Bacteroidota bacterium]|nr:epoxyqueuosine reductase [Bacteroidota bacterium]
MNSREVKDLILSMGADLCGIASVDRFANAPEGFRPTDIYPECKSVIVFAKKLPESIFYTNSAIPYSFVDDMALHEVLRLSFDITVKLEQSQITALPVPSEPYDYWDTETMTGKGLLSLKQAGYLAGLGVIGRNKLLCHPVLGNLIKLGAILSNTEFEADPIINGHLCSDNCRLCMNNCPSGAITETGVIQKRCRSYSEGSTKKGTPITICHLCRKICPNRAGWKKSQST